MNPLVSNQYDDNWFKNNPDCHRIGLSTEQIRDGKKYTLICYFKDLTCLQRVARLVTAVVATFFTAIIGVFLFEEIRNRWIEAFSGQEKISTEIRASEEENFNQKPLNSRINFNVSTDTGSEISSELPQNKEDLQKFNNQNSSLSKEEYAENQVSPFATMTKEQFQKSFPCVTHSDRKCTIKKLSSLSNSEFIVAAKLFGNNHFSLMQETSLEHYLNFLNYESIDKAQVNILFPWHRQSTSQRLLANLNEDNFKKVAKLFDNEHFSLMHELKLKHHLNSLDYDSISKVQVDRLFSVYSTKNVEFLKHLDESNFKKVAKQFSEYHFSLMAHLTCRLNLLDYDSLTLVQVNVLNRIGYREIIFGKEVTAEKINSLDYSAISIAEISLLFPCNDSKKAKSIQYLAELSEENFKKVARKFSDEHFYLMHNICLKDHINFIECNLITKEQTEILFLQHGFSNRLASLTKLSEDNFIILTRRFKNLLHLFLIPEVLELRVNLLDYDSITEEQFYSFFDPQDVKHENILAKLDEANFKTIVKRFSRPWKLFFVPVSHIHLLNYSELGYLTLTLLFPVSSPESKKISQTKFHNLSSQQVCQIFDCLKDEQLDLISIEHLKNTKLKEKYDAHILLPKL
jgi:hypothetical protein